MPERTVFQTDPGSMTLRQYSRKAGCHVDLIQRPDGSMYIRRIYDHPVPAYEALIGHQEPSLPQIYCYEKAGGHFHVTEEFVDGMRLSELLELCRPDDAQACAIVRQVCHALSVLHDHGFIHRDVKPENILLTSEGRVVLLDLDASTEEDQQKQQDTQLLGTVGYAAPEQFGFGRSNVRTDVFSVGVLLNVLCTGRHPSQHLTVGPLRSIVERCIEVNADKRFPSMGELLKHLPQTAGADRCPSCGFMTPGGGCIHCGKPGRLRRSRRNQIAIVTALAAILAAALLTAHFSKPEPIPELPPEPELEMPQAQDIPEISEVPVTTAEPEEPEFDLPGRPLTAEDIGEWCTPQMTDTLAPFELDGQTYYLHPGSVGMDFPVSSSGISSYESSQTVSYRISFWEKVSDKPEEYKEVTDPEVLQRIQDGFAAPYTGPQGQHISTLKLTMQAISTEGVPLPQAYPTVLEDTGHETWRDTLTAEFSEAHTGYWLITASGTINGQELTAVTRLWWRVMHVHTIEPDPTLDTPVIQQINEALLDASPYWTDSYDILMPAGEFVGYIEIPEDMFDIMIYIRGSQTGETIIHGGIHNTTGCCEVFNVHLIGAGKELDAWLEGSANFGRPNVAFYGAGMGRLNGSIVEGYDCGMVSTETLKTGDDTIYRNNRIGVRFATLSNNGGNHNMRHNRFEGNEIGFSFEQMHQEFPLSWFDFSGCEFENNKTDIQNLLDQPINTDGMIFW